MTLSQLIRVFKQGKQGLKVLRATDLAIDSTVYFEVSEIPFWEKISIELAKIEATESEIISFLASFNRLRICALKITNVAGKLKRLDQLTKKTNTYQQTSSLIQQQRSFLRWFNFQKDSFTTAQ